MEHVAVRIVNGFALVLFISAVTQVHAQYPGDFPSRPVRVIVPFAPGGAGDVLARILGVKLTETTGAQHVVDNRGGSGGLIGTDITAKSAGNGYTQLLHSAGISYEPALRSHLPYDTQRDLAAVTLIGFTPNLLVVHPTFTARNAQELIALAKQKPGAITFGSGGVGSSSHLAVELFQSLAGIRVNHIPYKGAGPALGEVIAGQIGFMIATSPGALPHVKSGRLRALGVTSLERSPLFPDLPAVASLYPGFSNYNWYGLFLPTGVPKDIAQKLHTEFIKALNSPDVRDFVAREGATTVGNSPEEFAAYFKREAEQYERVIRMGNIPSE